MAERYKTYREDEVDSVELYDLVSDEEESTESSLATSQNWWRT